MEQVKTPKSKQYRIAKVLVLTPLIIFGCFILLPSFFALLFYSNYYPDPPDALRILGVITFSVYPIPCLIMSIVGTIFAKKAPEDQEKQILFGLGIWEIVGNTIWLALLVFLVFLVSNASV